MGIKSKVIDSDYLSALSDLMKAHGVTVVLGQDLIRAVSYFINSIAGNLSGKNSLGKVQRDTNIVSSLDLLSVFAGNVKN